jgi:hypothetical protein
MNEELKKARARLNRLLFFGTPAIAVAALLVVPRLGWLAIVWLFYIGARIMNLQCGNCGHRVFFDYDMASDRPRVALRTWSATMPPSCPKCHAAIRPD